WAATHQLRTARLAGDRTRQTLGVLRQTAALETLLLEAETGQRGYLLTGELAYLEPYANALAEVRPKVDTLKRMVSDTPAQAARLEQVDSLAEAKLAELKQTVDLYQTIGPEAAVNVVNTHVGRGLMTRIHAILAEMEAEETAELTQQLG